MWSLQRPDSISIRLYSILLRRFMFGQSGWNEELSPAMYFFLKSLTLSGQLFISHYALMEGTVRIESDRSRGLKNPNHQSDIPPLFNAAGRPFSSGDMQRLAESCNMQVVPANLPVDATIHGSLKLAGKADADAFAKFTAASAAACNHILLTSDGCLQASGSHRHDGPVRVLRNCQQSAVCSRVTTQSDESNPEHQFFK